MKIYNPIIESRPENAVKTNVKIYGGVSVHMRKPKDPIMNDCISGVIVATVAGRLRRVLNSRAAMSIAISVCLCVTAA